MATALVLTPEGDFYQTDIPSDEGHKVIHDIVDGWFDCVRQEQFVGYVNDEGLLIGLPVNIVASVLFGRPLVGNCVILGSLNENGEYDGENYDVPSALLVEEIQDEFHKLNADPSVKETIETIIAGMDFSPTITSLSDTEFSAWLNGEGE
jgi:hypothetical protein